MGRLWPCVGKSLEGSDREGGGEERREGEV